MDNQQTDIAEIGEIGLIERIKELVTFRVDDATIHDNLLMGISDDTAVYRPTAGKAQLLTTDALVEGVHFDLTFTSFKHLGWKSMVASLSDIASMGGTPRYATITLALPKKISLEMITEFYQGVSFACKKHGCLIVGGDTAATFGNMVVSVTLVGEAEEQRILYRKGAKPGDLLCVSGHLGASTSGLKILQREKQRYASTESTTDFKPNLEPYAIAIEKHLMPKPRFDIAGYLTKSVETHALIDVSDGLATEVHRICINSNVGANVYEHNIPVEAITQTIASEFSESPLDYALYGGEEYELLFTMSDKEFEKLEQLTYDVSIIGRITDKQQGVTLIREDGQPEPLPMNGWDHFKK